MKKKLIISGILVLLFVASLIGRGCYRGALGSDAAKRWQGNGEVEYRRISVYFDSNCAITVSDAIYAKSGMSSRITEGNEEAKLLTVWGREEESEVRAGEREAYCRVILTGEDFFLMRGYRFLSGGEYGFGEGSVIANEYAAHALFGSEDCTGLMLKRGETYEKVHGVVRDGEKTPVLYAFLSDRGAVTFFETILPEYIKGYARDVVSVYFYEDEGTVIRENDTRYETGNLREELKKEFDENEQPISFRVPFWEYRERRAERILTVWNITVMIFSVPAVISLMPILWTVGARAYRWISRRRTARRERRSMI